MMQNTILFSLGNTSRNLLRTYARKAAIRRKTANPGIQKRLNILDEKDETNLENVNVEELESDFMSIGEMHREHEHELKHYKNKEKYWIVRQKYFKENKINFLTWNDKEQIRYLHQTNPAEWTIEKLSEGFPAMPETITKIIKGKWQLKSESKIKNHDQAVERNWKLLREGKFKETLSPDIINHLINFTSRKQNLNFEDKETEKIIKTNKPKYTEFSSIIQSYDEFKNKSVEQTENTDKTIINETKMIGEISSDYGNKCVPLSLIKKKENSVEKTEVINEEDISLKKLFHGDKNTEIDVIKNKYLIKTNSKQEKLNVVPYPEKIVIPKAKYKKGSTYKVNDCYYDDDGEFLYRVPGMY